MIQHQAHEAQRVSLAGNLSVNPQSHGLIPFKFRLKSGLAERLEKGASKASKLGTTEIITTSQTKKSGQKLLALLQQLGIREEHIPKTTKNIDDLLEKQVSKNGGNDSSIDEPNVGDAVVELDEFEALFRVAPSKNSVEEVKDFKIQRKPH